MNKNELIEKYELSLLAIDSLKETVSLQNNIEKKLREELSIRVDYASECRELGYKVQNLEINNKNLWDDNKRLEKEIYNLFFNRVKRIYRGMINRLNRGIYEST